jgi:hypothetical protein
MATAFTLTDGTFRSSRHTTHYLGGWSGGRAINMAVHLRRPPPRPVP